MKPKYSHISNYKTLHFMKNNIRKDLNFTLKLKIFISENENHTIMDIIYITNLICAFNVFDKWDKVADFVQIKTYG